MALVSPLVPWPIDQTNAANALECVHEMIGAHIGLDETLVAARAAAEIVIGYGSDAPQFIQDTALLRVASFLLEHPAAGIRSETTDQLTTSYIARQSPLRDSGAMSLLSPFKMRRGGLI